MRFTVLHLPCAILAAGLLAITACAEPVFRCAMAHWPTASYEATVFHRGPLPEEEQALITSLKEATAKTGANLTCATVDVSDGMDDLAQSRWNSQTNAEPPWLVLHAPHSEPGEPPLWTGRLSQDALDAILDSPARRKITEVLLGGDSAVWVLLECGDAIRDEATVDVLAAELQRLEEEMMAPPIADKADGGKPASSPPVRIKFSLIRVTRNDPAEAFLVNQLLRDEPSHRGRPVAFPVFGRGRVINGQVGRGLDRESITAVCETICAPCKCDPTKKRPGKHLLLSARWESALVQAAPPEVPVRAVTPLTNPVTVSPRLAPEATGTLVEKSAEEPRENPLLLIATGLILTAALAFVVMRPRRGV